MSGIAGIIRFDGKPLNMADMARMTDAMSHRGPDGITHKVLGDVAFGHCMLRTTPQALDEIQPLSDETGSVHLVMDGRLDNFDELLSELRSRGVTLRTKTDTELVLRAYELWGTACLAHFDGDFAFGLWDGRLRQAFCARDAMGNKPFVYALTDRALIFATDVSAIMTALDTPPAFDEITAAEYLALAWTGTERTYWQGIKRLPAAHCLIVRAGAARLEHHWEPELDKPLNLRSDAEYAEYYLHILTDTVRRQSRAIGPLACDVSGGLDSSAIFAVANTLARQGKLLAPELDGYTLKFDDDTEANELVYARAVAEKVGRPVLEITPTRKPLSWCIAQAEGSFDFPFFPNGIMSLGIREAARANGSRVQLSGFGGDQWLFDSTSPHADAINTRDWRNLHNLILQDAEREGLPRTLLHTLRYGCYPLVPERVRRAIRRVVSGHDIISDLNPRAWLAPSLRAQLEASEQISRPPLPRPHRVGQREKLSMLYSEIVAQACNVEERLAALAGIEMRRPFWTRAMAQFAFSTPNGIRQRGAIDKFCHRMAMRDLLPPLVLHRTTKADFTSTYINYTHDIIRFLLNNEGARNRFVDGVAFEQMVARLARSEYGAWPEKLIWLLFGMIAVCNVGVVPDERVR